MRYFVTSVGCGVKEISHVFLNLLSHSHNCPKDGTKCPLHFIFSYLKLSRLPHLDTTATSAHSYSPKFLTLPETTKAKGFEAEFENTKKHGSVPRRLRRRPHRNGPNHQSYPSSPLLKRPPPRSGTRIPQQPPPQFKIHSRNHKRCPTSTHLRRTQTIRSDRAHAPNRQQCLPQTKLRRSG